MGRPLFTPEELAELAAADAEIEAEEITMDEIRASRERDKQVTLENMDKRRRKIAEAQREYYAANREKIAEAQREYYAANREKIAEAQREYRAANRERIKAKRQQYYTEHKEQINRARNVARWNNQQYNALPGIRKTEAARRLGVSIPTIYHMIYRGQIEVNEYGRVVLDD